MKRLNTQQEEQEFEKYARTLLSSGDKRALLENLYEIEVPPPYQIRVKVVYSEYDIVDTFERIISESRIKRIGEFVPTYEFSKTVGKKYKENLVTNFSVVQLDELPNIGIFVSICKRKNWQKALVKLISSYYPSLVPVLLSQSEIVQSIKKLRSNIDHNIFVKSFSANESIESSSGKERKSIREWTNESFEQILMEVKERNQYFTSIDVEFVPSVMGQNHVRPTASCKIRKSGEVELSGKFKVVYDNIIKHIANVGFSKLSFYSGRGLKESSYKSRPLSINYQKPVFEETAIVRQFVDVMKKYPHSMYSVEHGNPYAHLKITDMQDGSCFNVYALPPERIAVIPGLKASEAAFERVFHYIFDKFKEGQVANYDDEGRTLESFIGQN
ncbi:MAG TPA: hypothetical protein VE912_07075 [Bacteroidales bacterium]|nr:hypothetical protein [Bacteroidales bacterium]